MDYSKNPIEMMGEYLAAMTLRAVEAERKLEKTAEKEDMWFQKTQRQMEQIKELEETVARLSARCHRLTRELNQTSPAPEKEEQPDAE